MAGKHFSCKFSNEAEKDLEEIYDFTADKFGVEQAIKYLEGFDNLFEGLCSNPKLGRERNEVINGLRSISYKSHTVFYRIIQDYIRVVRILHGSRDIVRFLPPQA